MQTQPPQEDPNRTQAERQGSATDPFQGLPPSADASSAGRAVPGYEILGELGKGGMGIVYKARQTKLNRVVALKMILGAGYADEGELLRFRTEAEAIARLQHPNIVQIHEVGEHDNLPYFSLEFCPGGSLDRKLKGTPLPAAEAAALVATLARAMHAAHEKGVLHRDLKPANILLAEGGVPKITDFGLAKKLDDASGQTQQGSVMGTPSYMPPEQARGDIQIGPAADIYSLGAILYDSLTGRPPFKAATIWDTLKQVTAEEPVPPSRLQSKVPRDLETICLKCLAKEPAKRYATAKALAEDLQRFANNEPILARPVGAWERAAKWARRKPFQAATLAAGLALVLASVGALYGQLQSARKDTELQRRESAEQKRVGGVQQSVAALYTKAEAAAGEAARHPRGDRRADENWASVERDTSAALQLLANEPGLADFSLAEPALRLRSRAQGQLADASVWAEARVRLERLKAHHGDATFFGSDFTGLDAAEGLARTRLAVTDGLALFNVTPGGGPIVVDPRFFTPAEATLITDRCYELLLLAAQALARPNPGEADEERQLRARQALTLLDRADRLLPAGVRTPAGLLQRSRCLGAMGEVAAAEQAHQEAGRTPPRLAADHFLAALEHYRAEDLARAMTPLSTILREQPDHYGAEYLLAVCRLKQGQYQAAREGLTRCLNQRKTFVWPLLLRGYAEMELQLWAAARADFDAVLQAPPDTAAAYVARVNRGVLALRRRDWKAATLDLKLAITRRPGSSAAYINLALAHRQQAEVPPAHQALLLLAPHGGFSLLMVDAQQRQARRDAIAVLDEAVRHCPREAQLYHERGRLHLLLDQPDGARADFRSAVALALTRGESATLADDLVELGRLLYRERKHEEAVQSYQAALKVRADRSIAWRLMAQPLLALKRYREAGMALDRFLESVPVTPGRVPTGPQARTMAEVLKIRGLVHDEQARAYRARGLLHAMKNDMRAALDSYTLGLRLARDPETLTLRGWTHLMYNAPDMALADFEEALKLQPRSANARIGRANARLRLGEASAALEDVEEGLREGTADARTLYNAARAHAQAVPLLRGSPGRRRAAPAAVTSERRSAELLGRALEATPAADRSAFWGDYVLSDPAFESVRGGSALARLRATYERVPR